jgi:hypothetical protein
MKINELEVLLGEGAPLRGQSDESDVFTEVSPLLELLGA